MIVNKYITIALNILGGLTTGAAAMDWSSLGGSKVAGGVSMAIFILNTILGTLKPAPGAPVTPTGGTIVTHT